MGMHSSRRSEPMHSSRRSEPMHPQHIANSIRKSLRETDKATTEVEALLAAIKLIDDMYVLADRIEESMKND